MNMGFKKSKYISSLGYFNENFKGYGFEDHEFAHRYYSNGFKLIKSKASIIHDEGEPNINIYSKILSPRSRWYEKSPKNKSKISKINYLSQYRKKFICENIVLYTFCK